MDCAASFGSELANPPLFNSPFGTIPLCPVGFAATPLFADPLVTIVLLKPPLAVGPFAPPIPPIEFEAFHCEELAIAIFNPVADASSDGKRCPQVNLGRFDQRPHAVQLLRRMFRIGLAQIMRNRAGLQRRIGNARRRESIVRPDLKMQQDFRRAFDQ